MPCAHKDSHGAQLGSPVSAETDAGALHRQPHPHVLGKIHGGVVHLQLVDADPARHGQPGLTAAPRALPGWEWGQGPGPRGWLLPGHGVGKCPQEWAVVGAPQVQLMLLLQQRLEKLQPNLPTWGRAGIWGTVVREGAAVPVGRAARSRTPLHPPSQVVWTWSPSSPAQFPQGWSGTRDPPNSSAFRVSWALMPGLVPVMGTQAVSKSRRQSHADPSMPWGWCWDLEAEAEDMAMGCPVAAETPSLCTSPARTYIGDREPGVTSASCAHAEPTAALWPLKAQPCPIHDSKGKPGLPLFPTCACCGNGGRQGPMPCRCQPPTLGGCGSWGYRPRGHMAGTWGHAETQLGQGPKGLWLCPAWE